MQKVIYCLFFNLYQDSFLRLIFSKLVKETVYRIFYSSPGQRYSVANYWNDPHHQASYLRHSRYLPYIDNVIYSQNSEQFKANFARISKLVLIGGPDDGVITPWQSRYCSFLYSIFFLSGKSTKVPMTSAAKY